MHNETQNYFSQLAAINVADQVEKKGQFSYLSWPYAVAQLRHFDDTATWEVRRFDGLPYLGTEHGTFVEVAVTVRSITLSQIHPVLDSKNRPLLAPNAFDINTSIQRCLVKAIALHGLGLNVYAGEDLPVTESERVSPAAAPLPLPGALRPMAKPAAAGFSQEAELLTVNQLRYIHRLMTETATDEAQLLGFFGYDAVEHIPKAEVNRVIRMLETNRDKEAA